MNIPRDNRWKNELNSPQILKISRSPLNQPPLTSRSTNAKQYIKIDDYEYSQSDLLGEGYTSKVYLGRLVTNKRLRVAIKVINRRRISKEKINLQLLKQQMNIHQKLDHPNIVKCYKIVQTNLNYYFFLEYCAQGTLESFIKRHQKLAESTTVTIMEQIISGYKYLTQHKILHRDLKPPNILKSGYNWKICDFGFSVIAKKILIGNINVGTPSYMAPEALERTQYSPKTDIFSLGVICYEMLLGKAPWQHKDQQVLVSLMQQKIKKENLSFVSNKNLVEFILKSCEPKEKKRMSLQQFEHFNFWKQYEEIQSFLKVQEDDTDDNSKNTNKTSSIIKDFSLPASSCPSQTTNFSTSKQGKKQCNEVAFEFNKTSLERQIYICKVILILMKTYNLLPLKDQIQKDLYLTVLTRHSGFILRRIIHNKFNYMRFKKWEEYSSNQTYLQFASQANILYRDINAVMKAQTRRKSIITIRIFNKKFDDLTFDKDFSKDCVQNLKEYIHGIMLNYLKQHEKQQSCEVYQTLICLKRYYKYISKIPVQQQRSRGISIKQSSKSRQKIIDFKDNQVDIVNLNKLKQEVLKIHI